MKSISMILAGLTFGLIPGGSTILGQETSPLSPDEKRQLQNAVSNVEEELKKMGLSLGLGAFFMSGVKEVKSAAPDANGVLRVDYEPAERLGFIFETHYLFGVKDVWEEVTSPLSSGMGSRGDPMSFLAQKISERERFTGHDFAIGPAICAEVGSNGLRSAGVGLMLSLRRYKIARENTEFSSGLIGRPFNLGLFYIIEPRVKTLADEFSDGAVIPAGTALRFEDKSRDGLAVVFSVTL